MRTFGVVFNIFVCAILSRYSYLDAVIYVENGKNVTLNPHIQGEPEEILWTFNGNKLAEHDMTEFLEYGQFKRRSSIENTTGKLTVRRMASQDSGIYRSVIQIDGKQQNSENEVRVIDAVQEPAVTCKLNNITKSKTLFCSVSAQIQASYEWTGSNLVQHSGQELPISKEEKPDSIFTCTVKNEVSQKKASFPLKDCPTDTPHPENIIENDYITLAVILSIIGAIIMIAMAVVIYFFCKKRNKAKAGTQQWSRSGVTSKEDNDVAQTLISNHYAENNKERDISDGKSRENEAAERMIDNESENSHNAEHNEESDISEDADKSEKNEEAKIVVDNESENSHNAEHNEESDISEDADKSEKNEEAKSVVDNESENSHNAEHNEESDISEDADKSEKNEEAKSMVDNESANDSKQRNSYSEDVGNKEQEMTDAENMSEERDLNESSKDLIDKHDPSEQRSESDEDLHSYEDDE
ncbi:hypothetical protein QQF64_033610 [Cirrhinus molitorella]|uniref:Immunoglobulin I-set domain-containing protein n=1 Tax=Cirrhinus molitorella TaxID=172907 RepID=A0ABR3MUD8_9TELE